MEPNVPISLDFFFLYNMVDEKHLHLIILIMHLKFILNITQEPECQK